MVIGDKQEATSPVFMKKVHDLNAPLIFAEDLNIQPDEWESDLKGVYQFQNKRTVLAALEQIKDTWKLNDEDIRSALKNTCKLTGFMGRWQILGSSPKIIADVAHNKNGLAAVMPQLLSESYRHLFVVFGVVKDKDLSGMIELLPEKATYLICEPGVPRKMDALTLFQFMKEAGFDARLCGSVTDAIREALHHAGPEDMIYIGGSSFVVADALAFWSDTYGLKMS